MSEIGNIWDIFDVITCINVKDKTDRLERVKSRFASVGIKDKVKYCIVERSQYGCKYGCCESHYNIIKEYHENNTKYGIIFEDDVVFNKGWQNILYDAIQFITSTDKWDVLYLGCTIKYPVEISTINTNIWNVKANWTHAYIISKQGINKFLNGIHLEEYKKQSHANHDVSINMIFDQMYCHVNNFIFGQEWKDSDNIWPSSKVIPARDRDLQQWFQCTTSKTFIPQCNFIVKLSINIPFDWRPCINDSLKWDVLIKRRKHATKRYTLQNRLGGTLTQMWELINLFYSSPTNTLRFTKYLILSHFQNINSNMYITYSKIMFVVVVFVYFFMW